ncbi:Baculoviral IAP repeat-containing protein 7-B [Trachymyrmex zeteki]|uniref:Baculoviral IAP repeat-containing protein 7-B n=1 Tax=Mycetomoellerius zeteki TaxID=64791 RepID=A0A151X3X2_9HYME|nr:Baculoviral IAP repeat-containing protein 7-B [Trachymyrmex zeteki]
MISLDYQYEAARLKSFHNWPYSWKKSEEFAAAGFFYTGESDIVKCFECGEELWKWKVEDDPMVDHQRYNRNCWFLRNISCGNVPISMDPSANPSVPEDMDECGIYNWTNVPKSIPNCGDQMNYRLKELTSKPKYPEYVNYAARLASYDKWPKAMSQTKEELATAGYYYSGNGDETLCYYCGGGLMDWDTWDDPWVEHAKWYKNCPYLLVTKGLEFVNNITRKTYTEKETMPSTVNELDKRLEEDGSESIASESTQNSLSFEETNNAETSIVSGKASTEEQSIQIQSDKPCNKDATLCKICFNRELQIAFIPCGHLLACVECASNMKICGICRKDIEITIQVYFT